MAVVRTFIEKELDRQSKHSEVEATISFVESDDEKFVQIDTYGSKDRAFPGKVSQSLRLSKSAFEQLVKLAENHF
ncbi:MAG: methionyl-tRNA formyltransferase [Sphingomonadales bacterium]|nr:methionyl-tRNA formyltransferase [Sphingomonadales bacterium]MBU3992549.1 methionyl-tRNA formyltransferase [Alphaproteobacteria bacterium]